MFKVGVDYNVCFSREFQPYVKLEDVLEGRSVAVTNLRDIAKRRYSQTSSPLIETIKEEIKTEELSEDIDDTMYISSEEMLGDLHVSQDVPASIKTEKEYDSYEIDSHEEIFSKEKCYEKHFSPDENTSITKSKAREIQVEECVEDWSSLELHLSPDSVEHQDQCLDQEDLIDSIKRTSTETIERCSEDSNLKNNSRSTRITRKSSRSTNINRHSIDMFEDSPEVIVQRTSQESSGPKTGCSSVGHSFSSDHSSTGDNRERQDEWNSQELSQVSQRLRLRTQQAKRLIMEVIRKRQMEDETLEAFKKRLRRM